MLIAWDQAQAAARHPERGHNVVFHEFAHKLDMLDGVIDGAPPNRQQPNSMHGLRVSADTPQDLCEGRPRPPLTATTAR